jgi:glycosyltransferase involved in cell wall biosynthesis
MAVTTFNRVNFLKECLKTWLETRNKNHEWFLIIADDGSLDTTIDFLYSFEYENKIIIKNQRNGIANQTNTIFQVLEKIDFDVCFKCDDDILFLKCS